MNVHAGDADDDDGDNVADHDDDYDLLPGRVDVSCIREMLQHCPNLQVRFP